MGVKNSIEKYTEAEFLKFLYELFEKREDLSPDAYEEFIDKGAEHFSRISEHPDRSDVIFFPKEGCVSTPEDILRVVKEWRAANNKPGFKPE